MTAFTLAELAGVYRVAADLLARSGWDAYAEDAPADVVAILAAPRPPLMSADAAIGAAAESARLAAVSGVGAQICQDEARARFAGYLFLTGRDGRQSAIHDLTGVVASWERGSCFSAPADPVAALRGAAAALDAEGAAEPDVTVTDAGLSCPECGSVLFTLRLGGRQSGLISCEQCGATFSDPAVSR